MNDEKSYWLAFSVFPGVGPMRFRLLIEHFGSARSAWGAPLADLKAVGLPDRLIASFDIFRRDFDIEGYKKQLTDLHVSVLTLEDEKYPTRLKSITDAPFVLYVKGRRPHDAWDIERSIGIVGTRKITPYGTEVTKRLVEGLVANGFTIVSGLAYGVDQVAHETAIASGGKTIAVLGCGIDIIAPPSNAYLYRAIAEDGVGAIVSEMPLGLRPNKGLFPARNRIISGLSVGVVVTEGAEDSGALITARNAGEQGREVFAVPGPITSPYSKGPLQLLKKGAKLVESVDDILEELQIRPILTNSANPTNAYVGETEEERNILVLIRDRTRHIDELIRLTNLKTASVSATLIVLEMKGIVKDYGEKQYGLNHR